jgi:hypothetical protein
MNCQPCGQQNPVTAMGAPIRAEQVTRDLA